MDKFYAIITGDDLAFFKVCSQLPGSIQRVLAKGDAVRVPNDTVISELRRLSKVFHVESEDLAVAMAVYLLDFGTYQGFERYLPEGIRNDENVMARLYAYAASKE